MTSAALGFVVSAFALLFTTTLAQVDATPATVAEVQKMSKDIYPLIGGAFACCGVFALYDRRKETVLHILGRVIFGMLGSFVLPWVWTFLPAFLHTDDYRGLVFIGSIGAILCFVLSKFTIERLFKRAPDISENIVAYGERQLDKKINDNKP